MKLSISVMAHPSRAKYFAYLRERLGDIPISVDGGWGIWENCKRAWAMADKSADFHCVIQDDAIICDGFREKAEKILQSTDMAYSFYYGGRSNNRQIAHIGLLKGYIISSWISWGVAICLPTKLILEMIQRCENIGSNKDDSRIATFLREKGIKTYFPMPSLIDHRAGEVSLVNDPGMGRKAAYFIDNLKNENK